MKRWAAVVMWISVVAVCPPAGAERPLHTGYWKEYTPEGESFKCQGVTSRRSLENVLKAAGWDPERTGLPKINWRTDEAVVIAPLEYPRGEEMVFYGLHYEGDELVLEYGWRPPDDSRRRTPRSTGTTSRGSHAPTEPSVIVVSFNKDIDDGYKFVCAAR